MLTMWEEVTLITWMGKGGGTKAPNGLQVSNLLGPAGRIHITSICKEQFYIHDCNTKHKEYIYMALTILQLLFTL